MQFRNTKRVRRSNTGYYLAALLCLVAVGLVVWTNVSAKKTEAVNEASPGSTVSLSDAAVSFEPLDIDMDELVDEEYHADEFAELAVTPSDTTAEPISETVPVTTSTTAVPKEMSVSANEAVEVSAQPVLYAKPVSGSVMKAFSGDTLVYSNTMDDWRVHNGVDIACKDGAMVAAATKGTVISAGKDDRYGNIVVVRSSDEMMIYYCGLDEMSVREGDEVQGGQKLGTIGSIPVECEDEPHLHLMVMSGGDFLDPIKALSLKY